MAAYLSLGKQSVSIYKQNYEPAIQSSIAAFANCACAQFDGIPSIPQWSVHIYISLAYLMWKGCIFPIKSWQIWCNYWLISHPIFLHAKIQRAPQQYIIKNNIKMAASELGFKVLATIQNLISEIDKPSNPPSARRAEIKQSLGGTAEEFDRYRVYSKMSYNFRKKHNQVDKILLEKVYDDVEQHQKFKVTNKTSLKILQKRQIKPIYERAHEIIEKKNIFLRKERFHMEQQERQAMRPLHHSIDDLMGRKYNENELQSFRYDIEAKNKERIKKRNMSKLNLVKKEELKIPSVNSFSRSLSSKRNVKKNYSQDVFQRMMQYNWDQNSKKIKLIQTRRKEEGNFEPVLCSKSVYIVQKMKKTRPNQQRSLHHHSHCQLPPPRIDKTPTKIIPRSIKKQVNHQRKEVSKEKEPPKIDNQQPPKPKKKDKEEKKVSANKSKTETPLKQKQLNLTKNLSTKAKSNSKNEKRPQQNKENKRNPKSKTKYQEHKY